MSTKSPRNLEDILGPAIAVESDAASFILGLDLACNCHESHIREQLAIALIDSAMQLRRLNQDGLRIERRSSNETT